ncbi:glycosyltransferase family 2 protein [Candidatus Omnitrophota bacterium]
MPLLSVVVPVYNEAGTIREILRKIAAVDIDKEIIVVDNCSTDGTQGILQDILKSRSIPGVRAIYHSYNKGKGESVKEGIHESRGDFVVIQDADLEYDPKEYLNLIKPLLDTQADLTLGARFTGGHRGLALHRLGNKFLTGLLNFLFTSRLNDYATCYKMSRRNTLLELGLRSGGFDIEAEIVCKALKKGLRIIEVPVSYYPRSYAEGKKIRWLDGLQAIISIIKYRIT